MNIDTRLSLSPGPKPRRALSSSFIEATLAKLGDQPVSRRSRIMHVFGRRPIAATALSLGIVCLLGGGAYGVANGFGFLNVLFGSEQQLPDGGRLLKLSTTNCTYEWYDSLANDYSHTDQALYYRIEKDSQLTAEQVAQMAQGACEVAQDERVTAIEREIARRRPDLAGAILCVGTSNVRITSLARDSMTTTVSAGYSGEDAASTEGPSAIDGQAVVIDERGQLGTWSDLEVGDYGEAIYEPSDDCSQHTGKVVGFIKNSANTVAYYEGYSSHYGKDFTRVVPCESDPSGYCASER